MKVSNPTLPRFGSRTAPQPATTDGSPSGNANGMYKSTDHGQTWTFYPFNIPALPYSQNTGLINWDIAEDPINGCLYVATEKASKPPCMPGCYDPPTLRSKDRGQTWQDVSGNLGSPGSLSWHATRIQVHPVTQDVYFQVEGGAVFVLTCPLTPHS